MNDAMKVPSFTRGRAFDPSFGGTVHSANEIVSRNPLPAPPSNDSRFDRINSYFTSLKIFKIACPINIDSFLSAFASFPNQPYIDSCIRGFSNGFWTGSGDLDRPKLPRYRHDTRPCSADLDRELASKIQKELVAGRMEGPFVSLPDYCSTVPTFVLQQQEKFRLIYNLSKSRDSHSFNDFISSEEAKVRYDTPNDLLPFLRHLHKNCPPTHVVVLWKVDIKGAFRLLPLHPVLQGLHWIHYDGKFYLDSCVSFGVRTGPMLFTSAISHLIAWYAANILKILALVFMDDFFGACYQSREEFDKKVPPKPMAVLKEFIQKLGIATSDEKDEFGQIVTITGFVVNAIDLTLNITTESSSSLKAMVRDWLDSYPTPRKLREWNSLSGFLNWSCNVHVLLKPWFSSLYKVMAKAKGNAHYQLSQTPEVAASLQYINNFLEVAKPARMFQFEAWNLHEADIVFYADACPFGLAVWFPQFNELHHYWYDGLTTGVGFNIDGIQMHIGSPELFAQAMGFYIAAKNRYPGKRLLGFCDNKGARANFDTLHSSVPLNVAILQAFVTLEAEFGFSPRVAYIPGKRNIIADAGSRRCLPLVKFLCPQVKIRQLSFEDLMPLPAPFASAFK